MYFVLFMTEFEVELKTDEKSLAVIIAAHLQGRSNFTVIFVSFFLTAEHRRHLCFSTSILETPSFNLCVLGTLTTVLFTLLLGPRAWWNSTKKRAQFRSWKHPHNFDGRGQYQGAIAAHRVAHRGEEGGCARGGEDVVRHGQGDCQGQARLLDQLRHQL